MIAQNEIEARRRRSRGSRQAENATEAAPPNPPFRRGRGVGPWEIPPGLSAASHGGRGGAIRLQRYRALPGAEPVGRSAASAGFFIEPNPKRSPLSPIPNLKKRRAFK